MRRCVKGCCVFLRQRRRSARQAGQLVFGAVRGAEFTLCMPVSGQGAPRDTSLQRRDADTVRGVIQLGYWEEEFKSTCYLLAVSSVCS